jgi:hypothetical protein
MAHTPAPQCSVVLSNDSAQQPVSLPRLVEDVETGSFDEAEPGILERVMRQDAVQMDVHNHVQEEPIDLGFNGFGFKFFLKGAAEAIKPLVVPTTGFVAMVVLTIQLGQSPSQLNPNLLITDGIIGTLVLADMFSRKRR